MRNRVVLDQSSLTGVYDFTLQYAPEQGAASADEASDTAPSIFTSIQEQLGLKLEPTKGPGEVLAIDHAEKPSQD